MLDPASFRETTGMPTWVTAVSQQGRIYVPVDFVHAKLEAALRHEYMHAAVYVMSNGRCPSWIDEGLSLWFEGRQENAAARLLRSWLKLNPIVPLSKLQRSFMYLPESTAKAAYAQSLFAVKDLISIHSPAAFNIYFRKLAAGYDPESAFAWAFQMPLHRFEQRLRIRLTKQAAGSDYNQNLL